MKIDYTTIYLARHGETDWNVKRLIQGHKNSRLNKNGENQARMLGTKLQNIHFDAIFSSDLLRAKRTAEIIALERKLAVQTSKLLRERTFGHFEGQSHTSFNPDQDLLNNLTNQERFVRKEFEDVESDEEITIRLITFIREVAVNYQGKTILVVSHGGVIKALLLHLGYSNYQNFPHKAIDNGAYVKLLSDGVDFFIQETKGIKVNPT